MHTPDSTTWTPKARSHQEEFVERCHRKQTFGEEVQGKRRMSYNLLCLWYWIRSSQYPFTSRFPELAKRRIQVLFALQRSCLAPNTMQLAKGSEFVQQERSGIGTTVRTVGVNAGKCFSERFEKISSPTRHRSVRTSTAPTVTWIVIPCLFLLYVMVTFYTLRNFVIVLSLFSRR